MTDETEIMEAFDARARRRAERRDFFRAFGAAAAIGGGLALSSCGGGDDDSPTPTPTGTPTPTPTPSATNSSGLTDGDILNFALNLEYLEAQFYAFAATGSGLPSTLLTGAGTAGAVTGGRQVTFSDPVIANYAREIAQDERAHVEFLRNAIGTTAVAMPAIDISATATSAFSAAARAAGLIQAGQTFDPYADDNSFLLGAYIFEDVGVSAYKGAAALLTSPIVLQAAAGILATEAYHAAMIRSSLYAKGIATPSLIDATENISNARDGLDGTSDIDQGVRPIGNQSNIIPVDANGIVFGRSAGQVLNIVYLNRSAVSAGGFFPAGLNGTIKTSAAN